MAATKSRKASMDADEKVEETAPEEAVESEAPEDENEEQEWDSYSMDPDEVLYEGGPTFAEINAWKDQYGDVYVTDFMGKYYVWRTLNRHEYRSLVRKLEEAVQNGKISQGEATMNNEEDIAELCIIHPKYSRIEGANHLAGVASTIAQQVMEASAFQASDVRLL